MPIANDGVYVLSGLFRLLDGNVRRLIAGVLCQPQHPIVPDKGGSGRYNSRCVRVRRVPPHDSAR